MGKGYEEFATWFDYAFTLNHLPGRIFIIAPATTILGIRSLAGITSQPVHIPRKEWASFEATLFLPGTIHNIPPKSWVRITKVHLPYSEDLAYVVGSSAKTDDMLIAVVPRIPSTTRRPKKRFSGRNKLEAAKFFDPDVMTLRFGREAVTAHAINDWRDFITLCEGRYAEKVSTRNPDTNEVVTTRVPLDLSSFSVVDIPPQVSIYEFDGQLFYCGLLLLPIYAYRTVERVQVPPIDQVIPFAESFIDSNRINPLLSQLHWKPGDRVIRGGELYELAEIQLAARSVSAFEIQHLQSEEAAPNPTPILLPMNELRRKFLPGDGVIVVAGLYKRLEGLVLNVEGGILHILTDDIGNYVSMIDLYNSFLF